MEENMIAVWDFIFDIIKFIIFLYGVKAGIEWYKKRQEKKKEVKKE